ncbi:MAG: AAA family ATPase, partial [Polyangiaceae bacterium]|nr:AAA family ATPase [Polyangiaceae bacterium]
MQLLAPTPHERPHLREVRNAFSTEASQAISLSKTGQRREGDFSGRARELGILQQQAQLSIDIDEPILVTIDAPSGIGKTRLLEQLAQSTPTRISLSNRSSPNEVIPFQAIDGLIENILTYLETLNDRQVRQLIAPIDHQALIRTFPELVHHPSFWERKSSAAARPPQPGDRHRVAEALARLLARISEDKEITIMMDDLQWADVDSIKLLTDIFCSEHRPRALVILAFRSESRGKSSVLRELFSGKKSIFDKLRSKQLQLQPLDRKAALEVFRLNTTQDHGEDVENTILETAQGSPLLLIELAYEYNHSYRAKGELKELIRSRLRRLSQSAGDMYQYLRCAQAPLPLSILQNLLSKNAKSAIAELKGARLAQFSSDRLRIELAHPSFAEVIFESSHLPQNIYHLRLARALERGGSPPSAIAIQYKKANELESYYEWLRLAAEQAWSAGASELAAKLYNLLLEKETTPPSKRTQYLERHAQSATAAGYSKEAAIAWTAHASLSRGETAARSTRLAAEQWMTSGAIERGEQELILVQQEAGLRWYRSYLLTVFQLLYARWRIHRLLKSPFPRPVATSLQKNQLAALRATRSISFISNLHGMAANSRYLELALRTRSQENLGTAFLMEAVYRSIEGSSQRDRVKFFRKKALDHLPSLPAKTSQALLEYADGQIHYFMSEFAQAAKCFSAAEEELTETDFNHAWELSSLRIFWASSLTYLGRFGEFDRRLSRWIEDSQEREDIYTLSALNLQM